MNKIINYIKEKQKEYHEGSPAYNVLRALEVELPSLFEPSEQKPPEPNKLADHINETFEGLNRSSLVVQRADRSNGASFHAARAR